SPFSPPSLPRGPRRRRCRICRARWERDKRLRMGSMGLTVRDVIPRNVNLSGCQVLTLQSTAEELKRGLRLIVWHLVASLVDTHEAEIACLTHLAKLFAVDYEWCVAGSAKGICVSVIGCQRDSFAPEP